MAAPTPAAYRTEAARQQRLANEAECARDWKKYHAHQQRAIELDRLAFKLEADEQKERFGDRNDPNGDFYTPGQLQERSRQ
jgi:hypothetical protein